MKPVPLVLLISSVLLSTHIPLSICRPRDLSILEDDHLQDVLLTQKLLQYLQRTAGAQRTGAVLRLPHLHAAQVRSQDGDDSLEEPLELSRRNEDPPISIDLTFHLLRNMIEMAQIENQREQAELNRKYLDEVGK